MSQLMILAICWTTFCETPKKICTRKETFSQNYFFNKKRFTGGDIFSTVDNYFNKNNALWKSCATKSTEEAADLTTKRDFRISLQGEHHTRNSSLHHSQARYCSKEGSRSTQVTLENVINIDLSIAKCLSTVKRWRATMKIFCTTQVFADYLTVKCKIVKAELCMFISQRQVVQICCPFLWWQVTASSILLSRY